MCHDKLFLNILLKGFLGFDIVIFLIFAILLKDLYF